MVERRALGEAQERARWPYQVHDRPPLTERSLPAALALEPTRSTRAEAPLPMKLPPPESRRMSELQGETAVLIAGTACREAEAAPPFRVSRLAALSFEGSR